MVIAVSVILALLGGALFGEISWFPMADVGGLFIDLLKMTVAPIAYFSITHAVISLGASRTRNLTLKAAPIALGMSFYGVALGLAIMGFWDFSGIDAGNLAAKEAHAPTFMEFIRGCVPTNPVKAFADGNMLQVITLAFFTGAGVLAVPQRDAIGSVFLAAQGICLKVTGFIIRLAPLGAFCLLWLIAAKSAGGVLSGYLVMVMALILGSVMYLVFCCIPTLMLYKVDFLPFLKAVMAGDVIGAVSGGATNYLAPRIKNIKEKTAIDGETVDYLYPLLAVLMRSGSCICVGIYTAFAASVYGVELTPEKAAVCILITVIALTAAPGIIGGTLMDCAIVWAAIGIPLEAVALLAGIDYIMDVIRTVLNIHGGEVVTACVDGKVCKKVV